MRIHPADVEAMNERAHVLALELTESADGPPTITEDQIQEALDAGFAFVRADHPGLTRQGTRIIVFDRAELLRMCVLTVLMEVPPGSREAVTEAAQSLAEAHARGESASARAHFDRVTREALMERDLMPFPQFLMAFTTTDDPNEAARLP